jgi:hypothetical protein
MYHAHRKAMNRIARILVNRHNKRSSFLAWNSNFISTMKKLKYAIITFENCNILFVLNPKLFILERRANV